MSHGARGGQSQSPSLRLAWQARPLSSTLASLSSQPALRLGLGDVVSRSSLSLTSQLSINIVFSAHHHQSKIKQAFQRAHIQPRTPSRLNVCCLSCRPRGMMRLEFNQAIPPRRPRPLASRGISWHLLGGLLGGLLARNQGWPSWPSWTGTLNWPRLSLQALEPLLLKRLCPISRGAPTVWFCPFLAAAAG